MNISPQGQNQMSIIKLDVDPAEFRRQLFEELAAGKVELKIIMRDLVVRGISKQLDALVEDGTCLSYRFIEGYQSDIVTLQEAIDKGGFDFWYLTLQMDLKPGAEMTEDDVSHPEHLRLLSISYGIGIDKTLRFSHKKMKTRERYQIQMLHPVIPASLLKQDFSGSNEKCTCETRYLIPKPLGVWSWWQQFACVICGTAYFCECFRQAVDKYTPVALEAKPDYFDSGWPHEFLAATSNAKYRANICHLCTGKPSNLFYCHPMYGSSIKVRYGSYIKKFSIADDIEERDAENKVREMLGVPKIGEGWLNETQLFKIISFIFSSHSVVREASPDWLGKQRLDVYIPELSIAVEYQGEQHFKPIELFGGAPGLKATRDRDKRKKTLCDANNVKLIYFRYDDELSVEAVEKKLKRYMPKSADIN